MAVALSVGVMAGDAAIEGNASAGKQITGRKRPNQIRSRAWSGAPRALRQLP
jgi:hypothetical protein